MACDQKTLLLISCYADGEATAEESAHAAEHLENCAECRKLVEEWEGSQQLLQWACALELPEEVNVVNEVVQAQQMMYRRFVWPRMRWNWLTAGGLAAAVILLLVGYWFATLPPVLSVGSRVAAGAAAKQVRIGSRIRLEVGPGSKLVRLDDRTVRLEHGWVSANVAHGTGFRIVTDRIRVLDRGTVFWVGKSKGLDCVAVEAGRVAVVSGGTEYRVEAGDVFMAGNGQVSAGALPAKQSGEDDEGSQLVDALELRRPQSADYMDMQEGLRTLAKRFPEARVGNGMVGGANETDGRRFGHDVCDAPGLLRGLREHFLEIAHAAGGGAVSGEWEIPVCYLLVDGIEQPESLPGGVYYVRLVASGGSVHWRLSDGAGHDADMPLTWTPHPPSHDGGESHPPTGAVCYEEEVVDGSLDLPIRLTDWPGDIKPTLQLRCRGILISDYRRPDEPLLSEMERVSSGVKGFGRFSPEVEYLDSRRQHRLAVQWSENAGRNLCRLAKEGHGGSVVLGVMAADMAIQEPQLPGGAYILKFVQPDATKIPHIELVTPAGKAYQLDRGAVGNPQGGSACGTQVLPGYGEMTLRHGWQQTDEDPMELLFWMLGRPDVNKGHTQTPELPSKAWAQGVLRIRKP